MFGIDDAIGIGGLGLQVFGGIMGSNAAKKKADAQRAIAGLEMQENSQKRLSMELDNRRRQMDDVRNMQRVRGMAMASATAGGSQFSSGLQGGFGNISGQSTLNRLAQSQNTQIGEKLFDLDSQIDQQKMNIADAESQMSTYQGIAGFGKDLMSSSSIFGKIFKSSNG